MNRPNRRRYTSCCRFNWQHDLKDIDVHKKTQQTRKKFQSKISKYTKREL